MNDSAIGSLRVVPKRPSHVHGDMDDGTTTRWHKAQSMGIDLHLPRPHPHRKMRGIMFGVTLGVGVWLLLFLTGLMIWRML